MTRRSAVYCTPVITKYLQAYEPSPDLRYGTSNVTFKYQTTMKKIIIILFASGCLLTAGVYAMVFVQGSAGNPNLQPPPDEQYSGPAFVFVEDGATFQGGDLNKFREWVQENIQYPQEDLDNNVFGRVTVQFAINTDGKVFNIVILRGVTPTINEEVKRVLLSSPDWVPARQGGRTVVQQFTIPVVFTLPD